MQSLLTESGKRLSTTWGVVLVALGVIALLAPLFAALVLIRIIMWLLIFAAIAQVIYAFQTRYEGGLFFKLLLALLYVVAGGLLLSRPVGSVIAVTLIIGSLLLADGIAEIALGAQLRHTYDARSGWLFASGILSVILGALMLYGFRRGTAVVGIFLGIRLVFKGTEHIVRSSAATKMEHIGERRAA